MSDSVVLRHTRGRHEASVDVLVVAALPTGEAGDGPQEPLEVPDGVGVAPPREAHAAGGGARGKERKKSEGQGAFKKN